MKKIFIYLFSIMVILNLGACADRKDDRTPDHRTDTIYENSDEGRRKVENIYDSGDSLRKDTQSLDDEDSEDGYLPKDIAILEEIPTIKQHLPLDELVAEVESDIPNKRIILFKSNETKDQTYKSIFIKSDQHLQIVSLTNEQLIYDGKINE